MKSEYYEIANFCQHRAWRGDISAGLTAVIGRNGSGKSNFLGGFRFMLTGVNPNPGTNAENIHMLAPRSEISYGVLVFSHAGVRARVRRNLRPDKPTAILELEDGTTIEGAAKVNKEIEDILGVGADVINDIIIVAQEDIFGFISKTASKRAEQFQRLFRTDAAEHIYRAIGEHLQNVPIPVLGVHADETRRLLQLYETQEVTFRQQLAGLPEHAEIQAGRDASVEIVRNYDERQRLVEQLHTLTTQQFTLAESAASLATDLTAIERAKASLQDALSVKSVEAAAARVAILNLQQSRQTQAARTELVRQIDLYVSKLQDLDAPVKPEGYCDDLPGLQDRILDMHKTRSWLADFVNSFADGRVECPTCHTPTADLIGKLEESKTQLHLLDVEWSRLAGVQRASAAYNEALQVYQENKRVAESHLSQAQQQLGALPQTVPQDLDEAALQGVLVDDARIAGELRAAESQTLSVTAELQMLRGRGQEISNQISQLQERINNLPVYTTDQRTAAYSHVSYWEKVASHRRQFESELAAITATAAQSRQQLQQIEAAERQSAVARKWHAYAQSMRDVVHRDAAPRFVAQRNLRRLQIQMNEYLEMFQTDFRVTADAGLSFIASFPDGVQQPASRLSGGQKVVLALAFRITLNVMFAEHIGMLYLDEPTAYLDEDHIRGFEPVLTQLRAFSASRGMQSIIVTHEQSLAPLFDSVIQL